MNPNSSISHSTSLILLLLSISFSSLWAQTGTIKGLITDSNHQSLPDINLSLEGTHHGAYLSDVLHLTKQIQLIASLRFNKYDNNGTSTNDAEVSE